MSLEQAELLLQKYFGYPTFRSGQKKIIESILAGHNTMGIMPTGGGKSICYQIPALMFPGITLVVSPLISLMKDQVDGLKELGIPATYINSSLSAEQIDQRIIRLKQGKYKLLYLAPERLDSHRFQTIFESLPIYFVTIDEAHCISQWGHDFRPSYRSMADMILKLPRRPIIAALTATATSDVREDIASLMKIPPSHIFSTKLRRENLSFYVRNEENRSEFIQNYLRQNEGKTGIIYCATRKETDQLHALLAGAGFSVAKYHGGMSEEERNRAQEQFSYDQIQTIIATNAFGMGIDKSNVRFVIHYNMPRNLECYYQEAGRAGRDGEKSECILLFSPQDIPTQRYLITHSDMTPERKTYELNKLQKMINYCHAGGCLQKEIVSYFGEKETTACGTCGNCRNQAGDLSDITIEAQKIFSCIKRMQERFGLTIISKVLRGSKSKRVMEWDLHKLSTYGILSEYTEKEILGLCKRLAAEGYISLAYEGGMSFPIAKLTNKAIEVLKGMRPVRIRLDHDQSLHSEPKRSHGLFEELRQLRKTLSEQEQLPPYMIFGDSTLKEMCRRLPLTEEAMRSISGVGERKYKKYGLAFLEAIRQYAQKHNLSPETDPAASASSDKEPSHLVTYHLYVQGKTIDEIAAERGLVRSTVEDHLLRAGLEGMDLSWDDFIPPRWEKLIMQKIAELGAHKLRPIKDALPPEVDYMAIKAAIAKRELLSPTAK
ncbi:DNA helicase RecQ [Thermoactinomyces sp. CICC 10522]|uniref:DNA helicase RecQ n=1 Tax=Thermoactinomyces sp. CICC 10522 TaxID=2767427 RepID=UPI0018DC8F3B|nr:DNA helicase RecQ [Thermoactinomyces sp. CICC 10522]MBH8604092.1 DNA helicase RecQ [Thermoactinomyces sp. CICC 10522]